MSKQKLERYRLKALEEHLELYHPPPEGQFGPGSGQFIQIITATEICIAAMQSHISTSYSVLQDPELYPLAAEALLALTALEYKLKEKERNM